jgi:hypothetical protein
MRCLVVVPVVALVLAGCSGGAAEPQGRKPAQEAGATTEARVQSDVVAPTKAQRTALVKALGGVHKGLVTDQGRVVEDAMKTCQDLLDTEGRRTGRAIVSAARLRFSGRVELTEAETRKVVTAVRDNICPDAAWP